MNQAHLTVEETVFEALCGLVHAAVLPENRLRRASRQLIDIGAESTEMAIYYGDATQLCSTVRICGDHFTRDLAQAASALDSTRPSRWKLEYGGAASRYLSRQRDGRELPTPENRDGIA